MGFRPFMLICLVVLVATPSEKIKAAVFRASGSLNRSFSFSSSALGSYDNSPSDGLAARGFTEYFGLEDTPFVRGIASSSASSFGLQAGALAAMNKDFEFGSESLFSWSSTAFASGIWSDVIVTGPSGPATVPISLNLNIEGSTFALATTSPSGQSQASSSVQLGVRGNGQFFGGTYSQRTNNPSAPIFQATGLLAGFDGNTDITTPTFNVPVNTPFTIELQLTAFSSLAARFSEIFALQANTNFLNTLTFATSGPIFNLPNGYTVNSVDAQIVDNVQVPETSVLALTTLGILMLVFSAIQTRRMANHEGYDS